MGISYKRADKSRSKMIGDYKLLKDLFEQYVTYILTDLLAIPCRECYQVTSRSRFKETDRIIAKLQNKINKGVISREEWKSTTYEKLFHKYITDFIGFRFVIGEGNTSYIVSENNEENHFDNTIRNLNPIEFLDLLSDAAKSKHNRNVEILYIIKNFLNLHLHQKTIVFLNKKIRCKCEIVDIKDFIVSPKDSGYTSLHLIVKLSAKGLKPIKTEIQLCNLLQHIYAEYEHKRYEKGLKNEEKFPVDVACCIAQKFFDDKLGLCQLNKVAIFFAYYVCMEILNDSIIDSSTLYDKMCNILNDNSQEPVFKNKEEEILKIINNDNNVLKIICELCYDVIMDYEISKYKELYMDLNGYTPDDAVLNKAFEYEKSRVINLLLRFCDELQDYKMGGRVRKLG